MFRSSSLILVSLLAACTTVPPAVVDAPAGWEAVADTAEGGFLVVGEMHGTEEIPAAFTDYVGAAASRGGRTLVGLELNPKYEAAFQAARASDRPRERLLGGMADHWTSPDGRGSEAFLTMLERLAAMDEVDVVFFDRPRTVPAFDTQAELQAWYDALSVAERQQSREESMAGVLNDAIVGYDRAIVLVGNIHAAETRFEFLEGADNMAMLLSGDPVTLDNCYDGGTFYNAMHGEDVREARRNVGGVPEGMAPPAMGLSGALGPRYDGYFYVGPITASPPAGAGE